VTTATDDRLSDDRLTAYRTATAAEMARYVAGREPRRHLYAPLRAFTVREGKGLRPALCLATCEAFGGTVGDALPAAAAIELLHAAFLIHDDIEDGSERRRGRAALHVEYGVPIALNAGDALATLSLRPLLDNVEVLGSRMTRAVLREFQCTMERTVEGQALELGWREDRIIDLTPIDYLDMVLRKTCAYTTILPLRAGALIGSWGGADLDAMTQFGFALGAAFQIQDDVLDVVSDRNSYGKDLYGDAREGKRTLMLIHLARNAAPPDRAFLEAFVHSPDYRRSERDVRRVVALMRDYGSIDFASEYAAQMATRARQSFDNAFRNCAESPALDFLRALVPFMIERSS
jgi:geranylgeranyl diphosphate synthase type II